MTRDSLILHFEYIDDEEMTPEEIGQLTLAMIRYSRDGSEPKFTDRALRFMWKAVKARLDADAEAYEERCRMNRENGAKGGAPLGNQNARKYNRTVEETTENNRMVEKTTENNPEQPKQPDIDIDIDNDTDIKEKDTPKGVSKEKAPKRFSAPSLEEVREYCLERGNNVDPERFCDFYDSVGWKVGNKPMKDWKAAVRTWERREEPKARSGTTNNFKNFEERKTNLDLLEEQYFRKKYANSKV